VKASDTSAKRAEEPKPAAEEMGREAEAAERALGRGVAIGLPVLTVVAAIVVGFIASVGSGLLVLASGVLIGAIALLWASVRTLSGDAPLPADLEVLAAQHHDVDALAESKLRVLRALKDLESEHAIGRIDDADYEALSSQYRHEAKDLMREMDQNAAAGIAEAERVAREYLTKLGLGTPPHAAKGGTPRSRTPVTNEPAIEAAANAEGASEPAEESSERVRVSCEKCATSNEADAAFCKKCGATLRKGDGGEAKVNESDATS
jgi:ribosomal protein S27E